MTLRKKLKEAAEAGNIDGLYAIIQKDPYILDRIDGVPFVDTPLHVAVTAGRDDFAMEVMNLKPSFARKLNGDGYSPIHLALRNEETGLRLLAMDKDLVRVKGKEGYTPLHHAAEQGNLRLLARFLLDCPECIQDVTIRNETALHVAAKKNQLKALQLLAQSLRRAYFYSSFSGKILLNWKDKDGNTVLHVAAYDNQPQMVKLLVDCKINVNEINSCNKTALDVLEELQIPDNTASRKARDILLKAEALNASSVPSPQTLHELLGSKITLFERAFGEVFHDIINMSAERSSAVLVILVLILTTTYEATLSPSGGVLQGDSGPDIGHQNPNSTNSKDGKSALSSAAFLLFYVPNTLAFIITMILTLGLLAMVARGITSLLLVPLLLLYFCLLSSTFDLSPTSAVITFGFLPLISLPIMLRIIRHAKSLRKYMVEKV